MTMATFFHLISDFFVWHIFFFQKKHSFSFSAYFWCKFKLNHYHLCVLFVVRGCIFHSVFLSISSSSSLCVQSVNEALLSDFWFPFPPNSTPSPFTHETELYLCACHTHTHAHTHKIRTHRKRYSMCWMYTKNPKVNHLLTNKIRNFLTETHSLCDRVVYFCCCSCTAWLVFYCSSVFYFNLHTRK